MVFIMLSIFSSNTHQENKCAYFSKHRTVSFSCISEHSRHNRCGKKRQGGRKTKQRNILTEFSFETGPFWRVELVLDLHSGSGNGWQLMTSLNEIYMCYCLLLDWMNVNIWAQHRCPLGSRGQASSTISEFGSHSGPCERAAKVGTVGKQSRATPTHCCYTICSQPQEGTRQQCGGGGGSWSSLQAHSGHSVCESWCKERKGRGELNGVKKLSWSSAG